MRRSGPLRQWGSALVFAAPVGALFLAARWTEGWISIAAWVAFFAGAIGLIALGLVLVSQPWDAADADQEPRGRS